MAQNPQNFPKFWGKLPNFLRLGEKPHNLAEMGTRLNLTSDFNPVKISYFVAVRNWLVWKVTYTILGCNFPMMSMGFTLITTKLVLF